MKYVIMRCEEVASRGRDARGLLESARMPHLLHLAQAGAAGVVRTRAKSQATDDRFDLHAALLGLRPDDPEAAAGRWYAAQANLRLADGETAWCCDLGTHQEGRIVDPNAGKILTTESQVLLEALNEALGSETRRWQVGDGSRHILVVRGETPPGDGGFRIRPPGSLIGQLWRRALPKGPAGGRLRLLIEQASKVLEDHTINHVRMDLGENPANLMWLWGSASGDAGRTLAERTSLKGAVVSHGFPMRGLAQSLGLDWRETPRGLEETALRRLLKVVTELLRGHDLVYVHLQIEGPKPLDRFCAMERIDRVVLKSLTAQLGESAPWRLLTVIDEPSGGSIPFVAIGTGLPQRPVARLAEEQFLARGLVFDEVAELFF